MGASLSRDEVNKRRRKGRNSARTSVIVFHEPREFFPLFVFCEGFGINVPFLDEPCAEFL